MKSFPQNALVALVLMFFVTGAEAEDWPTYMHDNARSGVTAESLRLPLNEHWVCRSPAPPQPAWPDPQPNAEMHKMKFDDAFYTVAADDTVYFASSVDHQVHAVDAATGAVRWRHFTGAPIRLAPSVAGGRVYAGSDDGKVYCLAADDGRVLWDFDAAPESRRVIGNGQIISLWPVRTGVLVDRERVFFGAGIFPYHSPALHALEAKSGRPIPWKDHVDKDWIGLSPQGYLLRTSRGLVVPCGRTMPLVVDCDTGKQLFSVLKTVGFDRQATGGAAGDYGVVVGDVMHIGTQNTIYGLDAATGELRSRWLPVHRLVASPESYFVFNAPRLLSAAAPAKAKGAEYEGVTALDRPRLDATPLKDQAAGFASSFRWRSPRTGIVALILAGDQVIAGGSGEVAILSARDGQELWKAKVDGDAVGLTVANGRLLVSTTRGVIHAFAFGTAAAPVVARPAADAATATVRQTAEAIVRESGARRGFALISGEDAVALACEIARQTELRITCVEPDPEKLLSSRQRVDAAGFYGRRVTVQASAPDQFLFPDYAANLVVHIDSPGKRMPPAPEILRVIKPCGGVLMLCSAGTPPIKEAWKDEGAWSQPGAMPPSPPWTKFVRGKLEGSGWWTHAYADAGASGSSGDRRITGNLSVLWFGEPGAGEAVERHQRAMSPLASNGRVFFQGWGFTGRKNTIICFDAYNGLRYWEREMPGALRVRMSAVSGNLACDDESLFVAAGAKCERLDAATGVTKAVYETPRSADGSERLWGHIAVSNGILFGSSTSPDAAANAQESRSGAVLGANNVGLRFSDAVFAFEIASGKLLWLHRAKEIRDNTIVANGTRLFFAENRGPATVLPARSPDGGMFWHAPTAKAAAEGEAGTTVDRLGRVVKKAPVEPLIRTVIALESATGKVAWEKEVNLTDCGVWGASASTRESAGFRELQALCKDEVLVFAAEFNQHDAAKPEDLLQRKAVTLSTRDGSPVWAKVVGNLNRPIILRDALLAGNVMRDLRTGEPLEKYNSKKSKNVPWTILNGGSCGTPSASDSMVFYRKGSTAWRGVDDNAGGQFAGIRPGCFINILPVGGVVVQPEASSGCTCNYSIQCTITFSPPVERGGAAAK